MDDDVFSHYELLFDFYMNEKSNFEERKTKFQELRERSKMMMFHPPHAYVI